MGKTWISENLDNIVSKYIRQWLELPIQDYIYQNAKKVLKSIRPELTDRLQTGLLSKVFIISFLVANTLQYLNSLWSRAQSKLPPNIFNFTITYLINTFATRKYVYLWGLSNTSECSFCLQPESLLHIVAACKTYLDQGRFSWRHNSALRFLAQAVQPVNSSKLCVDLPGYLSPCIITVDSHRPDMLLSIADNLYIIELTVGFETNLAKSARRRELKDRSLVTDLSNNYHSINSSIFPKAFLAYLVSRQNPSSQCVLN